MIGKAGSMAVRRCADPTCSGVLPAEARSNQKYCTKKCRVRVNTRRHRRAHRDSPKHLRDDAKPVDLALVTFKEPEESEDGRGSARRGPQYRKFVRSGLPELISTGQVKTGEAAERYGCTSQAVSRWMAAWYEDKRAGIDAAHWERNDEATGDFDSFSRRYFPDLLVPQFHVDWSRMVTETLDDGGRLLLLAPQRHGKSEMLIRYCLWRIVTNPDISIIWVGKTASLAEKMVGYIRQILEHHEVLRDDFLPPGEGFEPPNRSGLSWTNGEFTVSNRTKIRKSPTMAAIGVGGTILGRDADLVIVDDPIDRKMMASADARDKVAEWFFTDLLSRKEEDTGLAYIGSRQHVDDLPARIMTRPDWRIEVYQSHDPLCPLPEHDVKAHVDCVLWPDKRSFKWLMEQKNQNPDHFERNYQNNPSADTFDRPSKEDLERAWDTRPYGKTSKATRVLASVDPGSGVKKHAICVWAYNEDGVREVVDVLRPNAGTPGMARGVREVYDNYRVVNWIWEKNRYEDQIRNDAELQELRNELGLNYHMHFTSGVNKHDPAAGVMAMLAEFRKAKCPITLPGGNPESRLRIAPLVREILVYDPDFARSTRQGRDDLVMAMWVGWFWMTNHVGKSGKQVQVHYPRGFTPQGGLLGMGWNRPPDGWRAA